MGQPDRKTEVNDQQATADTEIAIDSDIFTKVRTALTEALGLDDDDVQLDAELVGGLSVESIDFLDIVFKLERAFDITIERDELGISDKYSHSPFSERYNDTVHRVLTEQGLLACKEDYPHISGFKNVQAGTFIDQLDSKITVRDLCMFVMSKSKS